MTEDHNVSTGGYEDQLFLDLPPESPHCPVCLLVVREPHVLVCCGTPICQVSINRILTSELIITIVYNILNKPHS